MSTANLRRATAIALLLVVPLTLAPRTSWTLESVQYDLAAGTQRDVVREKTAVPLTLEFTSRSDDPITARVVVDVTVDGAKDAVVIPSASRNCVTDGPQARCSVAVPPRGVATATVIARPLTKGQLLFAVDEGFGGDDFGALAVEVIPAKAASQGHPRR